jgi:hypothetical protein
VSPRGKTSAVRPDVPLQISGASTSIRFATGLRRRSCPVTACGAPPKPRCRRPLWNPRTPYHKTLLKEVEAAAPSLRLQPLPIAAQDPREFEGAFAAMAKANVNALFVADDPVLPSAERCSSGSRPRTGCPRSFQIGTTSRPVVSCHTGRGGWNGFGPPPRTWTRSSRGEASRSTRGSGRQTGTDRQPQDHQEPRPHDPADGPAAGGPRHRVEPCSTNVASSYE